ncbi:c-Myc-binding protein [Linum perenne]
MMRYREEKEAKKEAFRKYLESSGVVDTVTKALVALYEQDEKPSSALEFIQQKLGGPSVCEYEKLQAEMSDLQLKHNELMLTHQQTVKELEELKNSSSVAPTGAAATAVDEVANGDVPKDDD